MTWMSSCPLPALSLALILLVSSKINPTQAAKDSINQIQGIKEGETLVSKNNIYVLGFFQTSGNKSSTKFGSRYLGIWYKFSNDTVVWVANRQNPITDTSSFLSLGSNGELMVEQTDEASNITRTVWSSNSRRYSNITNPIASLLDSGNLVITSEGEDLIWQSFDYPTDTLLPGMKLGFDKVSGKQWNNTSWSQENDPSIGEFVFKIMATESHENVVAKIKTNEITYRGGTWNGHWLSGNPGMSTYNGILNLSFIDNQNTVFYTFQTIKKNEYSRLKLFPNGSLMRSFWTVDVPRWITYWTQDTCDTYSRCGPNGICNLKNDIFCDCFPGYRPKSNNSWINRDYSQGCVMKKKLNCVNGENNFLSIENIKIPNTINSSIDRNITLDACKIRCSNNCSCLAYASFYILPNKGCILWFGDLIDTKTLDGNGQKIYLRLPSSEILTDHSNRQHKKRKIVIIAIIVLGLIVLISYVGISLWNKKMKVREVLGTLESSNDYNRDDIGNWKEKITLFDLSVISQATNNFSTSNKIGEGGFGSVYKGTLLNGKEIAVKKLSNVNSGHGLNDFMNEAMLIQQLRHRNLVRFLGCCMEGEERLLIYEFVPNKSLDIIIFGENKHVLDWKMRVEIIIGIARGLLYLHQDSALRIIHRDLKAGNILLDEVMNPKITDFGTARLFESNQVEGNTRRVIGTPGYMSPEYITNGNFSMKSDVFSFGILLLEIITGKRNRVSYKTGLGFNLLDQCWTIWKDGNILELVDESLHCLLSTSQVFRFVKIGLLCVQDLAIDRPLMSNVLFMLSNENSHIPDPKRSRFWSVDQDIYGPSTSSRQISYIVSDLNFTKLDAR